MVFHLQATKTSFSSFGRDNLKESEVSIRCTMLVLYNYLETSRSDVICARHLYHSHPGISCISASSLNLFPKARGLVEALSLDGNFFQLVHCLCSWGGCWRRVSRISASSVISMALWRISSSCACPILRVAGHVWFNLEATGGMVTMKKDDRLVSGEWWPYRLGELLTSVFGCTIFYSCSPVASFLIW